MKRHLHSRQVMLRAVLLQCAVAFPAIYLAVRYHVQWFGVNWLPLFAMIFLIFMPLGHQRFHPIPHEQSAPKSAGWLKVLSLQFSLYALFFAVSTVFGPQQFVNIIQTQSLLLGLFPWPAICLIALTMGMMSQHSQKDVIPSDIMHQRFPMAHGGALWSTINAAIKSTASFAIAISMILMIALSLRALQGSNPLNYNGTTLIVAIIALGLFFLKPIRRALTQRVEQKGHLPLKALYYTVVLSALFGVLTWLLQGLQSIPAIPPSVVIWLHHFIPISNAITLILHGLWILYSFAVGVFIAMALRGQRIRNVILITSIVPIVIALLCAFIPQFFVALASYTWFTLCIGLLGLLGIFQLLWSTQMRPCFLLTAVSYNAIPKPRIHTFYFRKLYLLVFAGIAVVLPIGPALLALVIFAMTLPVLVMLLFTLLTLYHQCRLLS